LWIIKSACLREEHAVSNIAAIIKKVILID